MSEIYDIIGATVGDREGVTADPVANLTRNFNFVAEIEANPDVTLDAELGNDLREQVILHVRSVADAARIQAQDRVQFTLFGQQVVFQVLERSNNPASPFVDFRCKKVVTSKDA